MEELYFPNFHSSQQALKTIFHSTLLSIFSSMVNISISKMIRHVIYLLDSWVGSIPNKELVDNPIQGDATASWMI